MDHSLFMPIVRGMAAVHRTLGGGMPGLVVMQFGFWLLAYVALVHFFTVWMRNSRARWAAGSSSYLATGLLMPALAFYAITPAMNWIGVAYLTLVWPLWTYAGVGVPTWLAPHMFNFG